VNLCGLSVMVELPDAGHGMCCYGAVMGGPHRCTCWERVFDLDQVDPDPLAVQLLAVGVQPVTRRSPCHDCAYRPDSPERQGDPGVVGDAELLEAIVQSGQRFWCHQGIRQPTRLRHPSGVEIPAPPHAYDPPKVAGVPYRADGTPAEVCAGWAARRHALEAADG
jgi:hypothetical protein